MKPTVETLSKPVVDLKTPKIVVFDALEPQIKDSAQKETFYSKIQKYENIKAL